MNEIPKNLLYPESGKHRKDILDWELMSIPALPVMSCESLNKALLLHFHFFLEHKDK